MNAASSLFAALPPSVPETQQFSPASEQAGAAPAPGESFYDVMSQLQNDATPTTASSASAEAAANSPAATGSNSAAAALAQTREAPQSQHAHHVPGHLHSNWESKLEAVASKLASAGKTAAPASLAKPKTAPPSQTTLPAPPGKPGAGQTVNTRISEESQTGQEQDSQKDSNSEPSKGDAAKSETPTTAAAAGNLTPSELSATLLAMATVRTVESRLSAVPSGAKETHAESTPPKAMGTGNTGTVIYTKEPSGSQQAATSSASSGRDSKSPATAFANGTSANQAQKPDVTITSQSAPPVNPESRTVRAATRAPAEKIALTEITASRAAGDAAPMVQPVKSLASDSGSQGEGDGTRGALTNPRMSNSGKKNEIAGDSAQKVPTDSPKDAVAARAGNGLPAAISTGGATPGISLDVTDKASPLTLETGKTAGPAATSLDHAALQAEQIGKMVNQQVVMVRQSGASNLAVSLKLDPQTELNLQLTSHGGQIEASLRFERGSVAGLENHWKDLQDSLARQNVQLLPLEVKPAARPSPDNTRQDSSASSFFKQSSQNSQRQSHETRQEPPPPAAHTVSVSRPAAAGAASRKGWESYA